MQDHVTAYLDDLGARGHQPGSAATIGSRLASAVDFLRARGCRDVTDVRPDDLEALLLQGQERQLARETLRHLRSTLRGFFCWLHEAGKIISDPSACLDIDRERLIPLPPPPLSEAEVFALLDAIPRRTAVDLRNRAHLELLYGCGLRLSESISLTLDDLDLERRTLLIRGKGGHERLLPVMSGAAVALEDYLTVRRTLLKGPDLGILFLGTRGRPVNGSAFRSWLRALGKRALGSDRRVHPHLFRHSIAVHLLRGGADVRHVQEFLGHADLDTTKIYLRLVPGHLREDYDESMPEMATEVSNGQE